MTETFYEQVPFPGLLADLVLVVHAGFVVFVVGGQIAVMIGWARGWTWVRNPWFRGVHLLLIVFIIAQTWLGELCPLTVWESELRNAAGQSRHDQGFIQHWLGRLIFLELPWWVFQGVYTAFGALVVISWALFPPTWRRPSRP